MEHRTPSGKLCPYADMTDEELDDYEEFADEIHNREWGPETILFVMFFCVPVVVFGYMFISTLFTYLSKLIV